MEELLRHNEVDLNKKRQESDQQKQDDNEIIERERCNLQVGYLPNIVPPCSLLRKKHQSSDVVHS